MSRCHLFTPSGCLARTAVRKRCKFPRCPGNVKHMSRNILFTGPPSGPRGLCSKTGDCSAYADTKRPSVSTPLPHPSTPLDILLLFCRQYPYLYTLALRVQVYYGNSVGIAAVTRSKSGNHRRRRSGRAGRGGRRLHLISRAPPTTASPSAFCRPKLCGPSPYRR